MALRWSAMGKVSTKRLSTAGAEPEPQAVNPAIVVMLAFERCRVSALFALIAVRRRIGDVRHATRNVNVVPNVIRYGGIEQSIAMDGPAIDWVRRKSVEIESGAIRVYEPGR